MQFQTQVYGDYRFIHQMGEEKLGSEKWIICMYLTQQFYNFEFSTEDITSVLRFYFHWLVNTFTNDTEQAFKIKPINITSQDHP